MGKLYWKDLNPENVRADQVIFSIEENGIPTGCNDENASFEDWWRSIPEPVIEEIMFRNSEVAFEVMAYLDGLGEALDYYEEHSVKPRIEEGRKAAQSKVATANSVFAEMQKKNEDLQLALKAAHLEILHLKAEFYDMMHEGKGDA